MRWDNAAEKAQEMLPIPPIMAPFARIQSEKIARQRGLDCVTADVVKETARVYRDFMGEEKTAEGPGRKARRSGASSQARQN